MSNLKFSNSVYNKAGDKVLLSFSEVQYKPHYSLGKAKTLLRLSIEDAISLKRSLLHLINFRYSDLQPDLRVICDEYNYYSSDGFPSLNMIGVATADNDWMVLSEQQFNISGKNKYKNGDKLTNLELISRLNSEILFLNQYLKVNPESYSGLYYKHYLEAYIIFLKKGLRPFISEVSK
jgi:hypothetical protein